MALQHLRSSTANKRPLPAGMSDGQLAINTNLASPGLFFKDSNGDLVKVGPVHVGTTAPNASPASGGQTGNTLGEQWLDTTGGTYVFKVWDGSAWRSESGTFVDVNGDVMTGALGIIAGTAGSPGLYISGDTNTGIYSPGADQVSVATGGTERLRIDSNGQIEAVSLGTDAAPVFSFTGDPNTGIYSPGADQLALSTNGTGRLFVDSSGRVGVGIASPTTALHAKGIVRAHRSDDTNARYTQISFEGGTASLDSVRDDGQFESLTFRQSSNGGSSYTERMRLDSSGRLGIGTSSPSRRLHVSVSGTGNVATLESDSGPNLAFVGTEASGRTYLIGEGLTAAGLFQIYDNNASAARLTVNSSGSVGIGSSTPDQTLVVNGGVGINNGGGSGGSPILTITNSGGSPLVNATNNSSALTFGYNGTEAFRVDSSRRLLVGTSSARTQANIFLPVQTETAGNSPYAGFGAITNSNDTVGSYLILSKSRGTSVGSSTIVQSGDVIGDIWYTGADGSSLNVAAARISCQVDGTPGANDMPGRLVFSTTADGASSPTERMRISQNGTVSIGTTTSSGAPAEAGITFDQDGASRARIGANGNYISEYYNASGSLVGYIQVNSGSVTYSTTSDYRLKENLEPLSGALERLGQLSVYRFNFTSDPAHRVDGFVAHEVQAVVPEAISGEKDAINDDGSIKPQGIDQSKLVPLLTAALQEAVAKIESLEARLTAAGI